MLKWQKILASLVVAIASLFVINVKALQITAGNLPDLPDNPTNYVIITADVNGNPNRICALIPNSNNVSISNSSIINTGNFEALYYLSNDGESWSADQGGNYSELYNDILATTVPIYNYAQTEVLYNAGYGFPVQSIFDGALDVVTAIIGYLATVTTAIISNTIFQLVIGAIVLYIVIGIIHDLVKRFGKKGRAMRASARYWKQPF